MTVVIIFVSVCCVCTIEQSDGTVKAKKFNPAISMQTITDIHELMKSGLDIADIVDRLRTQTVPPGYPCHPWRSGIVTINVYIAVLYTPCTLYSIIIIPVSEGRLHAIIMQKV